jgi:hypothetical protein
VSGAVGKLGRSREGVGEEWGREDESTRERLGGSAAEGKWGGKKVGVPSVGVPRGKGVPWGLAPTSGPSVALADDVRRARVPTGQSGERGA